MRARIPELTGLRCVAVMMVVFGHALATAPGGYAGVLYPLNYFADGGLGVQIFFVLSGFLITTHLRNEWEASGKINLFQFYVRRSLRIWPASYAYILFLAMLALLGSIDIVWPQFAFAALHLWNYSELLGLGAVNAAHHDGSWYLGHFWSLALEEQFYWFWPPLLILLLKGRDERLLLGLIFVIPIIRVISYYLMPSLRGQLGMMLHTGVDSILMGCYAALRQARIRELLQPNFRATLFVTLGCVLLILVMPRLKSMLGGYWSTYGVTLSAGIVGGIVVAIANMRGLWLSRLLSLQPLIFVGTISYSLYLWQQLFLFEGSPLALPFPLNIVQAFGAATLSYWLIEVPFLRLKERRKGSARTEVSVPPGSEASAQK